MFITIAEIVVSVLLIVFILIQERSSGLSGVFGGSGDASYQTRRGIEKGVFWGTIILSFLFVLLALIKLIGV
jgi:protein translocase SecG subunit